MCIYSIYRVLTYSFSYFFLFVSSGGWLKIEVGLHTISQTILQNKSNRQADLDPAPLPSVFLPKLSSQTDIGVEIVQSSVRVRN